MIHNRRLPTSPADHRCFSCGNGWAYIGDEPPALECPACGTAAATPVGSLRFVDVETVAVESDAEITFARAEAQDWTGRTFRYLFRLSETPHRAILERIVLRVAGATISFDVPSMEMPADEMGLSQIRPLIRNETGGRPVRIRGREEVR